MLFYVLECCDPRRGAQSSGSSSLFRWSENGIKVVSIFLNILRPSRHPQYSPDEHFRFESLIRSRISNISVAIRSVVEVLILAIMVGILKAVKSDTSVENNTKAFNVLLAICGGVLCSFPRRLLYAILHLIHVHQCFVRSLGLLLKSADRASFYLQDLLSQRLDSNRHYLLYGNVFVWNKRSCTSSITSLCELLLV